MGMTAWTSVAMAASDLATSACAADDASLLPLSVIDTASPNTESGVCECAGYCVTNPSTAEDGDFASGELSAGIGAAAGARTGVADGEDTDDDAQEKWDGESAAEGLGASKATWDVAL